MKEYFFDDDTFTDDLPRAEAIARGLGKLGVTWSCNAKANVPYETLRVLRENGLRLLLVGYESGSQTILNNIKKGVRVDIARRFTRDARSLGITIHGTFIVGLPGESRETIEDTIRYACEIDPHTIQVSIAAPYPGTELFRQARENGWLAGGDLLDADGRAEERAELSGPAGHGDLRGRGALLPALLLPPAEDERDGAGDAAGLGDDEAPPARRAASSSASSRAAARGDAHFSRSHALQSSRLAAISRAVSAQESFLVTGRGGRRKMPSLLSSITTVSPMR